MTVTGTSSTAVTCDGRGDGGGHCCWIAGQVCEFLDTTGPAPRCSVWLVLDPTHPDTVTRLAWKRAPVGLWFATNHPGYTCRDWPQNIPAVMAAGVGLCCWAGVR